MCNILQSANDSVITEARISHQSHQSDFTPITPITPITKTVHTRYGKRRGTLKTQQRMGNVPANQGSLFNGRHAVLHSLRPFIFIFPMFSIQGSLFNVRRAVRHSPRRSPRHSPRRSPFAAPIASRLAIRRFLLIFPNFSYSNFAIQCSPRR